MCGRVDILDESGGGELAGLLETVSVRNQGGRGGLCEVGRGEEIVLVSTHDDTSISFAINEAEVKADGLDRE